MTERRKALLLVGSPKPESTSLSLGGYLLERLAGQGLETETLRLVTLLRRPGTPDELVDAVARADLVVLAFPVYVDSLPALATEALEVLAEARRATPPARRQQFAAICNCGFPESSQCRVALAICGQFARSAGFEWAGGMALGGGGAVDARPLADLGGMARGVRQALDLAAESLGRGEPIAQEAVDLIARPLMPAWLYRVMANWGFRREARRNGVARRLLDRPYEVPTTAR